VCQQYVCSVPFSTLADRRPLVLCGRWESYPREFAKCRRCRKAKYCGKECQSTAWSEGHRFWCSAKDGDDETGEQGSGDPPSSGVETSGANTAVDENNRAGMAALTITPGTAASRTERRAERERERHSRAMANIAMASADTTHTFRTAFNHSRGVAVPNAASVGPPAARGATSVAGTSQQRSALRSQYPPGHPDGLTPPGAPLIQPTRRPIYDPYLAVHSASFMDQGFRRRSETITGVTSVVTIDGSPQHVQRARLRPTPEMYLPQQHLDGNDGTDRTDAGPSRVRLRGDNGLRTQRNEQDMVLW
jgi:hypothetical protein